MSFASGDITTTDLDELLKNLYAPWEIAQLVNLKTPVLGFCAGKGSAALGGTGFIFPARTETASGIGYITESQVLPASGQTRVRQATVSPTIFIGKVEMTGLAKAVAQTDASAFARSFDEQVQQTVANMASYKEGAMFRDGSGLLGTVDAIGSAASGIIGVDDVGYFRMGMGVDINDVSDGSDSFTYRLFVADIDWVAGTITLASNVAGTRTATDLVAGTGNDVAVGDRLYLSGTYIASDVTTFDLDGGTVNTSTNDPSVAAEYLEPIGFDGAFAESGTYLGISRTTVSGEANWRSNVLDANGNPLVEDILLRGRTRVTQSSGISHQEQNSMFKGITHGSQLDQLFKLAIPRIRYSGNDRFDLGNSQEVEFGSMKFLSSHNAPTNKCFVGDWSHFMSLYLPGGELHVDTEYNGAALKWSANQDAGISFLKEYCAFACDQPNAFILYDDLAEATR